MQENNQNMISHDDEINLGELFVKLWEQKWIIVACVVISFFLAFIYAKTRPEIYEVKAVVTTAENDELYELNLNGLKSYTPEAAFKLYFKELKSPTTLRAYYQQNKWYLTGDEEVDANMTQASIDSKFLSFLNSMRVSNSTPEFLQRTIDGKKAIGSDANIVQADIKWTTSDSEKTAEFINGYLEFVNEHLSNKILKEQKANKQQQLADLKRAQELALEVAKQQRELRILKLEEEQNNKIANIQSEINNTVTAYFEDLEAQIVQLKESLAIAEGLNIVEPQSLADFYHDSNLEGQIEIYTSNADNSVRDFMLTNKGYLLGTKFLTAEIIELEKRRNNHLFVDGLAQLNKKLANSKFNPELESLKSRKDDKPFVEGYIKTLDKIAKLEKINLDIEMPNFYQLTQPALAPGYRLGRSSNIYLAVGIVLGAMIGLFLALINIAVKNYREKNQTA